jgi:hypothetical protein
MMTDEVPGSPAIAACTGSDGEMLVRCRTGSVSVSDSDTVLVASAGLRPARFAAVCPLSEGGPVLGPLQVTSGAGVRWRRAGGGGIGLSVVVS